MEKAINKTKKNMKKRNKKGFTLIELVVVIAILGILAAILVPVISGFIETANQATDNANARLVYQAGAMWFAANNASDDDLVYSEIGTYLGSGSMPTAKSTTYGPGTFSCAVTSAGVVTVSVNGHTYDPATGKLS